MRRTVLFVVLATCAALTLPEVASAARPRCFGKRATIVGTNRADTLKGTPKADVIAGLGGNDTIKGLGRGDTICGGDGRDKIIGGDGNDLLFGDEGNDQLLGGGGFDVLFGGLNDDRLEGGGLFDLASYFFSDDGIVANLITGSVTGEGTDTLTSIEMVEGSRFDDALTGDEGPNIFYPDDGNDTIDGGGGLTDGVSYAFSASAAVTIDLNAGTATGQGTDSLTGIEWAEGSRFNDTIIGDAGNNSLWGLAGDDSLDGGLGTDSLDGGDGTDTCLNGENNSRCEV